MRKVLTLMITLLLCPGAYAQDAGIDVLQDIYNALSDLDDFDEDGWQGAYEILTEMAESPQNINEATIADLRQVPLLSESHAAAILHYRSLYGDLHSMSELSLITALDRPRQMLLSALFYAVPTKDNGRTALTTPTDSIVQTWRTGYRQKEGEHNRLLANIAIPTYQRAGYADGTYRGYALSHFLRYTYSHRRYQIAFTASQDAGEPFFAGTNKKGWDFYTGFFRMKNTGILSNLVAGHYQMSLGMGLILNNTWRLSRTSMLTTPPSFATVLRGHSSRQEDNYLQGVGATIALPVKGHGKALSLTTFASYRPLDATMSQSEHPTVTTILTTGYHRTESEIVRRSATRQTALGASLAYKALPFHVALNVVHVSMRDSLLPNQKQMYRYYYPKGKSSTSASLTYAYVLPRLQVSGETAVSERATRPDEEKGGLALATMNNVYWKISNAWTAFAVQRFYSYRFQSLLGKSFGDVSNVQNETGIYVGASTTVVSHLSLSGYIDLAYHPWHRSGYDGPSRSFDTYLLAIYTQGNATATMRYRYREQALASDGNAMPAFSGTLDGTAQHTLRTSFKYSRGRWTSMSQLQGCYVPSSSDWGFLISQAAGYRVGALSLWASLAWFNTSAYASRLYLTDRSLTYGATSVMLNGKGIRTNILGQYDILRTLTVSIRCSTLKYFDRSKISSSHQQIDASSQTDIQLQMGWKF